MPAAHTIAESSPCGHHGIGALHFHEIGQIDAEIWCPICQRLLLFDLTPALRSSAPPREIPTAR